MAVTVSARKTVSFASPYIGDTFQRLTADIVGRDGYLAGGVASDDTVNITIAPFKFISRGIIGETLATSGSIPVPTGAEPWFLFASMSDDDPDTGVQVEVTDDLATATQSAIIAFKTNGQWQNPLPVDVAAAARQSGAAETGSERGFELYETINGSGEVTAIKVGGGELVDPDGVRRFVPGDSLGASITPRPPSPSRDRTDYVVVRQVDQFSPVIREITGGTFDIGDRDLDVAKNTSTLRIAYYAKPGGTENEQWFLWQDPGGFKSQVGPTGGENVLAGATGSRDGVWIAGQRANGDIVCVVALSDELQVFAIDAAVGTVTEGITSVLFGLDEYDQVRAELDGKDQLHIVYEYAADEQVYYLRCNAASGANFAILRGPTDVGNGAKCSYPDVAVDRLGNAHVVYQFGPSPETRGSLAYRVIAPSGSVTLSEDYAPATDVGLEVFGDPNAGFAAQAYSYFYYPRIVVTPHDEVFVSMIGESGGGPSELLLFSPSFASRLGFPIVNANDRASDQYIGQDIMVNETGDLRIVALTNTEVRVIGVDTVYAPDGRVGDSRLLDLTVQTGITTAFVAKQTNDPIAAQSPHGDLAYSFFHTGTVNFCRLGMWDTDTEGSRTRATPHPKDVYLGGYYVPADGTGVINRDAGEFRLFNIRPKRLNFPFLAGDNGGRYQGFDGLYDAIDAAGSAGGGTVIVRPGTYAKSLVNPGNKYGSYIVPAGVSIIGEPSAFLEDLNFKFGHTGTFSLDDVSGNIISRTAALPAGSVVRGDYIKMSGSGYHQIVDILPDNGTYSTRFLLRDNEDGSPGGLTFQIFNARVRFENFGLRVQTGTGPHVEFRQIYQGKVSNLVLEGGHQSGISFESCQRSILDCIDATRIDVGLQIISLTNGLNNVLSNIFKRDTSDTIDILNDEQYITLHNVAAIGTANPVVTFEATRTTPAYITNLVGDIGGDTALVYTNVGHMRVSDGMGAITFEDENTRASGVYPADKRMRLTSSAHKEFEGTGTERYTVTEAMNARVKVAGDTMTGNLDLDADLELAGDVILDVDNTHMVGDWAGDLRLVEVASGQGNFGRVLADNTEAGVSDVAVAPLNVKAADGQTTPLGIFTGSYGMQPMRLPPHGMLLPRHGYFRDDFIRYDGQVNGAGVETGPDGSNWGHTVASGGTIGISPATSSRHHTLRLQTTSTAGSRVTVARTFTAGEYHTNAAALPCFAAKVYFSSNNYMDWYCGLFADAGWGLAFSYITPAAFAGNFAISLRDSAPSGQSVPTGVPLLTSTWYYLFLGLISSTQIAWSISTTPDFGGSMQVAAVPGTGTITSENLYVYAGDLETNAGAGGSKTAYIDSIDFWENAE